MNELIQRVKNVIDVCWESFSAKVGHGLINVNKEASMQLHFAYLLKNSIDIAIYHPDENVVIELETGIQINGKLRECDIVIMIEKGDENKKLPIELKCYRTKSSSGGNRGGQDLFKHGIYEDLELLENYANESTLLGIQLSMCDSRQFVYPKNKKGKSWNYDISDNTEITNEVIINTPINGKPVSLKLFKRYKFKWNQVENFYFIKLQGI